MKNILKALCVLAIIVTGIFTPALAKSNAAASVTSGNKAYMVTTTNENENNFWVCTFQLIWNDLMDKIVHGPVKFFNGDSELADILNRRGFTEDMLSPNSYYKIMGPMDKSLKTKIEKDILSKFGEKSDVLDKFLWPKKPLKGSYFLYTMLIKKFEFTPAFSQLDSSAFENSQEKYKFFGINERSENELRKNVKILFYNSENEYAIMLKNNKNEDLILYRTDVNKNFDETYKTIERKTKNNLLFGEKDTLKVPFISVNKEVSYDSLCGRPIKNTDYFIVKAIQTVKFDMDNKGGKLKSEAAMQVMKTSIAAPKIVVRNYLFDKKFYLFMKESDKPKPYFALKVKNGEFLVKH